MSAQPANYLASYSDERLRAGIARGESQLRTLDSLEQEEPCDMGSTEIPSKQYEQWSMDWFAEQRMLAQRGIAVLRAELLRRSAP